MKKKLIVIAVAAVLSPAAAMADISVISNVSIYGRAHLSVDNVSGIDANTNKTTVNSNSSRFGVKGDKDLGMGLKGMFQLESGVNLVGGTDPDGNGNWPNSNANGHVFTNARDMFLGLGSSFGTVKGGKMGGANQWVYDSNLFADQLGDAGNFNSGAGVGGRLSSLLMYETPDMSGFKAGLTYIPAESLDAGATKGEDSYGLKLDYANKGFGGHLAYFDVETITAAVSTQYTNTSIAGSYDFGNGMVTAQFVRWEKDVTGAASLEQDVYNIGGKFNVSPNGAIKAQYSRADDMDGTPNSGANMFAIGYDHKIAKEWDMYVVYARTDNDAAASFRVDNYGHGGKAGGLAVAGEDPKGFGIGLSYNF